MKTFVISCTEKATVVTSYQVEAENEAAAIEAAKLAFANGANPIECNTYVEQDASGNPVPTFDVEAD